MVFGNSLAGIALAAERVFADLEGRRDEVRLLITPGATPWDASLASIRAAVRAEKLTLARNRRGHYAFPRALRISKSSSKNRAQL